MTRVPGSTDSDPRENIMSSSNPVVAFPGHSSRILLHVVSVNEQTAIVQDESGFTFECDVTLPEFMGNGSTITLRKGQNISVVVEGPYGRLTEAVCEDDLKERPQFEGAPEEIRGWTPGIATGPGFAKQ
jgi:hypothetical protein